MGEEFYLISLVIFLYGTKYPSDEFRSINQSRLSLCSLPAAVFSLV